jgi:hypothetical protein
MAICEGALFAAAATPNVHLLFWGIFLRYGTKTVVAMAVSAAAISTIAALSATSTDASAAVRPAEHVSVQTTSSVAGFLLKPMVKTTSTIPAAKTAVVTKPAPAAAVKPVHTVYVWTGGGAQASINACRGGVDMTARYGVRTVAEHWTCGGSGFPTSRGSIVRITGIDAGIYRVKGVAAVLNAYTAHTYQIPRGYSLLFQTCRGNDSHFTEFVALEKVRS